MAKKISASVLKKAYAIAQKARENAYAPYSKFQVGAALILENEEIISGCNIENASYGATICAERTAIFSAVAQQKRDFSAIVLVTDPLAVPCGLCLQVMAEFFPKDLPVYLSNTEKLGEPVPFSNLLPFTFDSSALTKKRKS